jgi:archaeosine synthase beta-subunit
MPCARALECPALLGGREQVVVHSDHHRDEHDRIVEEMKLDTRQPQLQHARGHWTAEQVVARGRLNDQQQVLDVMPELDAERHRPPPPIFHAGKPRTEDPQPNQHHQRVGVVQHFGLHQPWVEQPEHAERFRHRPAEHVDLKSLKKMFAPVRKDDDDEGTQGQLVVLTVQTVDHPRIARAKRVGVGREHVASSIEADSRLAAIVQMHYLSPYPELPAARDRFVVDLRRPRPSHDPWRFQGLAVEDELSERGDIAHVGTVFLTGRECPWRCAMCDLWRYTLLADTPRGAIPAQLKAAREQWRANSELISRVKLYNASNFFDPRAVPEVDYQAIAAELNDLDQVIVESHPSLIGPRVERFQSTLDGASLEVAMGLETAHPAALDALNKRMTPDDFARAARWLHDRSISVRVFLLIYPPFIRPEEQDDWLRRSVEFAASCGASVISLVPARGGNGAMEALTRQGSFVAPTAADVSRSFELVKPLARRVLLDPWASDAN